MNAAYSVFVPIVLTAVVSAFGWQISQTVAEIGKIRALVYSLEDRPEQKLVAVTIENVSATETLLDLGFELNCVPDATAKACFVEKGSEIAYFAEAESVPPHSSGWLSLNSVAPLEIQFIASLAPGQASKLSANRAEGSSHFRLLYAPNPAGQGIAPVAIFESASVLGYFLKYRISIMLWGTMIAAGLLIGLLIFLVIKATTGNKNIGVVKEGSNVQTVHAIFEELGGDGGRRGFVAWSAPPDRPSSR